MKLLDDDGFHWAIYIYICTPWVLPRVCKSPQISTIWFRGLPFTIFGDAYRKGAGSSIYPIGSMYGIFTYIWLILMVNVGNIPYMDLMGIYTYLNLIPSEGAFGSCECQFREGRTKEGTEELKWFKARYMGPWPKMQLM